jgi:hypothetical protein
MNRGWKFARASEFKAETHDMNTHKFMANGNGHRLFRDRVRRVFGRNKCRRRIFVYFAFLVSLVLPSSLSPALPEGAPLVTGYVRWTI